METLRYYGWMIFGRDNFIWNIDILPFWFNISIVFLWVFVPFLVVGDLFLGIHLDYSKFGHGGMFKSRIGMVIGYIGGLLLSFVCPWWFGVNMDSTAAYVIVWLIRIHFSRRMAEILFLHRYSGEMGGFAVITIFATYSSFSLLTIYGLGSVSTVELDQLSTRGQFYAGVILFIFGQVINTYHHFLLASLRRGPGNNFKYVCPSGGLFSFVVCPHYLGEVITWFGLALAFPHAFSWTAAFGTLCYLSGRSAATLAWYKEKKIIPTKSSHKRLVPFVF